MTRLTSGAAEEYLASHCFDTGPTGFVAASVQLLPVALLPVPPMPGPVFERLRHGHLTGDFGGVLEVSVPPSPGLDVAVRRLAADLALARTLPAWFRAR
jgi:glutamate--cysteine ligase